MVDDVPEVPMGDDHAKMHIYGAVAPLTGRTHDHLSRELGRGEFAAFLRQRLSRYPGRRLLVIHDRAGQHHGTPVVAVVQDAKGRLILHAQSAYSPELNSEERIWKWMRQVVTYPHWFDRLSEPIDAIRNFFRDLAGVKAQVQRLCGLKTPGAFVASLYSLHHWR